MSALLASREVESQTGWHGIRMDRATAKEARFRASPIPNLDKAAAAVHRAAKAYKKRFPEAEMEDLLWSVEEI